MPVLSLLRLIVILLCFATPSWATDRLPARDVVQSGHSLTDDIMAPLAQMVRATHMRGGRLDAATLPGSPMDWRWSNPTTPDIRQPSVLAQYDVLVLTERVPLSRTLPFHDSLGWAARWATHAWDSGGLSTVLYASWVETDSGPGSENPYNDPDRGLTFRVRLPIEMAGWQAILDHMNASLPPEAPAVRMIPGPLIMAAAHDAITAGEAPGLSDIGDLFKDDIHLNPMGAYLIALAHYAVIYEADPRGLPHGVPSRGGPNAAQATWMQDLVWRVLTDDRAAGR